MPYNSLETGMLKEMKAKTDTRIRLKPGDRCNRHHAATVITTFFVVLFLLLTSYFCISLLSICNFFLQNIVHLFRVPIFCLVLPSFSPRFLIRSTHFAFLVLIFFYCSFPFTSFLTPSFSCYLFRPLFSSCLFSLIRFHHCLYTSFVRAFLIWFFMVFFLPCVPLDVAVSCLSKAASHRISARTKLHVAGAVRAAPKDLVAPSQGAKQWTVWRHGCTATEGTVILTAVT